MGILQYKDHYYVFSSQEAAHQFANDPDMYVYLRIIHKANAAEPLEYLCNTYIRKFLGMCNGDDVGNVIGMFWYVLSNIWVKRNAVCEKIMLPNELFQWNVNVLLMLSWKTNEMRLSEKYFCNTIVSIIRYSTAVVNESNFRYRYTIAAVNIGFV